MWGMQGMFLAGIGVGDEAAAKSRMAASLRVSAMASLCERGSSLSLGLPAITPTKISRSRIISAQDGLLQILSKAYASRIYRESIRVYVQNI
jgi:hypothetical protein